MKKIIRGTVLRYPAGTRARFAAGIDEHVRQMTKETKEELLTLFKDNADSVVFDHAESVITRTARELGLLPEPETFAMDASFAENAQRIITTLTAKFTALFDRVATVLVRDMVQSTLTNSETALQTSLRAMSKATPGTTAAATPLKEVAERVTLKMTPKLAEIIDASSAEATALIKRIPAQYLPKVQNDVMRSITSGNGLQDLVPALEKHNVEIRNWAENTARDQTRKVYSKTNEIRMQDAGVKKAEWIHSGGSNKPREYHMAPAPAGLNGLIFNLSDPPIIDKKTGERGMPGQLIHCGCTMRPIIDLDDL